MRDINRIKPLLEELETLWKENPDLRFGQLVYNISQEIGYSIDIFYPEDGDWLKAIKKLKKKSEE
jgi:uncharacterized protein YihD (DUF1040 family)